MQFTEHNKNITMSDVRYWYELNEMLELLHLVIAKDNFITMYAAMNVK